MKHKVITIGCEYGAGGPGDRKTDRPGTGNRILRTVISWIKLWNRLVLTVTW